MAEKIKKTITEMNFEVELIAVKEEQWGAEVIARVIDTGTVGNSESMVPEAVGMAYKNKYNIPNGEYAHASGQCVIPDASESNAWYTHVRISLKKQK